MNVLPERRERADAPEAFRGCNWSSFWLLNCELWPYIGVSLFVCFFSYFLKTLVAGKVHSLLINFLFITAQRAVFIISFFNVGHFKLLAIKRLEKWKAPLVGPLSASRRLAGPSRPTPGSRQSGRGVWTRTGKFVLHFFS